MDPQFEDHMTNDARDFSQKALSRRISIVNANGEIFPVITADIMAVSSKLPLSNTLFVRSIAYKLLSVSQITKQLHCVAIIYSDVFFLQDIHTKEIVGRGIERGGLHYLEDINTTQAYQTTHSNKSKEEQIYVWHHRLVHPSFGYLKHLFYVLFLDLPTSEFKCETCILAKSHRNTYPLSSK